jgi:hypothetical protein
MQEFIKIQRPEQKFKDFPLHDYEVLYFILPGERRPN